MANVTDFFINDKSAFVTGQVIYLGGRFLTAVHWLLKRITAFGDKTAVISETRRHSYRESSDLVFSWDKKFAKAGINAGAVTAVCGDYSADTIAALIALLGWRTIVVPITQMPIAEMEKRFKIASCDFVITPKRDDICVFTKSSKDPLTPIINKSRKGGFDFYSAVERPENRKEWCVT